MEEREEKEKKEEEKWDKTWPERADGFPFPFFSFEQGRGLRGWLYVLVEVKGWIYK